MTWIQTHTGRAFDLLEPRAEDVDVADIAHALARINRFSGHTHGEPYSVAHHSMLVADLLASWGAPPAIVREGLLHDAAEAYYGDITSPVKRALRDLMVGNKAVRVDEASVVHLLAALESLTIPIDRVVRASLVLPEHESAIVKRADLVALAIERRDLFGGVAEPRDWALPEYAPTSAPCSRIHVVTHTRSTYSQIAHDALIDWREAKAGLLAELARLDAQIGGAS